MYVSTKKILKISQNCFGALCCFNRDRVKDFFILNVSTDDINTVSRATLHASYGFSVFGVVVKQGKCNSRQAYARRCCFMEGLICS